MAAWQVEVLARLQGPLRQFIRSKTHQSATVQVLLAFCLGVRLLPGSLMEAQESLIWTLL